MEGGGTGIPPFKTRFRLPWIVLSSWKKKTYFKLSCFWMFHQVFVEKFKKVNINELFLFYRTDPHKDILLQDGSASPPPLSIGHFLFFFKAKNVAYFLILKNHAMELIPCHWPCLNLSYFKNFPFLIYSRNLSLKYKSCKYIKTRKFKLGAMLSSFSNLFN